jgi:hypothetical protein
VTDFDVLKARMLQDPEFNAEHEQRGTRPG